MVEETPAPGLSDGLRARLAAAAVDVARHAGYENAGTVEFLVDGTGDDAGCYFLEMNTRLQVEHPVTELVTGVDLVEAQLAVAAGRRLPWTAGDVAPRGHAIECRVYAEDPAADYLPQAGRITGYHEPAGPGIRIDSGVGRGSDVPVHYDPLLAKLAAAGRTREQARRRAHAALGDMAVLGLRTNIGLLRRVLAHEAFVAGGRAHRVPDGARGRSDRRCAGRNDAGRRRGGGERRAGESRSPHHRGRRLRHEASTRWHRFLRARHRCVEPA